ncbi:hypothetical protein [Rhodococcoides yunnanense]|uniref:hypothetical protein n=1 Tax=Rhodococcoides yunnanense TaxID=278209 RepID=UPI000932E774|nr:hypothetical protein [Rhodococcus yunnanensis]
MQPSTELLCLPRTSLIDPIRRDYNYEVNLAQARVFAAGLAQHIERCTASIEIAQSRAFRARADKALTRARDLEAQASSLRKELYEMYRQIDKMSERFPELRGDSVFGD